MKTVYEALGNSTVYLKAYCLEAAEMRTFRLDRIVEVAEATVA